MSGRGPDSTGGHNRNSVGTGAGRGTGLDGSGGSGSGADECDFVQTAPLSSPVPAVVSALSVGDVLAVELQATPSGDRLVASTASGQVAGSLTHPGHLRLVRCIGNGHAYRGTVVQKTGALVALRIEPA